MNLRLPWGEPKPLTDDEIDDDPLMGDPLDAGPESYEADPDDHDGGHDLPQDHADPGQAYPRG